MLNWIYKLVKSKYVTQGKNEQKNGMSELIVNNCFIQSQDLPFMGLIILSKSWY